MRWGLFAIATAALAATDPEAKRLIEVLRGERAVKNYPAAKEAGDRALARASEANDHGSKREARNLLRALELDRNHAPPDAVTGPGPGLAEAVPKEMFPAEMPDEARRSGWGGSASCWVLIDAKGKPVKVEAIDATDDTFAREAVRSLHRSRFKPATRNGTPVVSTGVVDITFKFQPSRAHP